jgi:hypothetical protein
MLDEGEGDSIPVYGRDVQQAVAVLVVSLLLLEMGGVLEMESMVLAVEEEWSVLLWYLQPQVKVEQQQYQKCEKCELKADQVQSYRRLHLNRTGASRSCPRLLQLL